MKSSIIFFLVVFTIFRTTGQDKNPLATAKTIYEHDLRNTQPVDTSALKKAKAAIDEAWNNVKYQQRADAMALRAAIYARYGRLQAYPQAIETAKEVRELLQRARSTKTSPYDQFHYRYALDDLTIIYEKAAGKMFGEKKFLPAIDYYRSAYYTDTTSISYLYNSAVSADNLSVSDKKYIDTAIRLYSQILPKNYSEMPNVYINLSRLKMMAHDTIASMRLIDDGIAKYPNAIQLYNTKGSIATQIYDFIPGNGGGSVKNLIYERAVKYRQIAAESYRKSLRLDSRQYEANFGYAIALLDHALEVYNGTVVRKDLTVKLWNTKVIETSKWLDEAYPFLKKAADIDGFSEAAASNLAIYYRVKKALEASSDPSVKSNINVHANSVNGEDIIGPVISVDNPANTYGRAIEVNTNAISVSGTATDTSGIYMVYVNGSEAYADQTGKFRKNVALTVGLNTITIKALDLLMNSSVKQIKIKRLPAAEDPDLPPAPKPAEVDPEVRFYALIISVQNYNDKSLNGLNYPQANADSLVGILNRQYVFPQSRIIRIKDPNRKKMLGVLDSLSEVLGKDDNLLVFYAGHGQWQESRQQGYWIPADGEKKDRSNWISNGDIRESLAAIHTRHTLLISDACFSGSIFKKRNIISSAPASIRERYRLPSRRAITSGTLQTVPDNSIFMKYLLQSLQTNNQLYLTALKLFENIQTKVIDESPTHQYPLYGEISGTDDKEGGDFIFIRRH